MCIEQRTTQLYKYIYTHLDLIHASLGKHWIFFPSLHFAADFWFWWRPLLKKLKIYDATCSTNGHIEGCIYMRNSSTPVQLLCRSSCPPNRYKLLPAVLFLDYLAMFGTREKAAPIGNKLPYCVYVYIYSIRISIHKRVFPSLDIFCFLLHQIEPRMWVEKESLFSLFRQRLFVSCNFFSPKFLQRSWQSRESRRLQSW